METASLSLWDEGTHDDAPGHTEWPAFEQTAPHPQDHFVRRDGVEFAGTHLIIDLWGASRLDDLALMESALRRAVTAAKATLLHIHLHHFTPNGGISGVAVLAESHISVHTWPERDFAAFDVFMCGDAEPRKVLPILEQAFAPTKSHVTEHLRGRTAADSLAR
ncbi:MAG: adenosylmethionine decarboxylase [Pseudomonadota bacterium]